MNKKWRQALFKIYCSRAFLHHPFPQPSHSLPNKQTIRPPRSPSHAILDVKATAIDQPSLPNLVKEKNLQQLLRLGGVDGIASYLETDTADGIDAADISRRRETFGANTYSRPPPKSFFYLVLQAFKDLTILILLICAALSLGFGIQQHGFAEGWYDGGSIFLAVFLVAAVTAGSNFRQGRQFEKLSKVSDNIQVEVIRSGRRKHVSIFEIVVGDIVNLRIGDQIPADGLFVAGHSLTVDESSMTGESDHVEVDRFHHPFLTSGTKVADGYATMLVTAVGASTAWAQLMSAVSRDADDHTPLQKRLNGLTSAIGKVGLTVALLVLVVLLVRYFTGNTEDDSGNREFHAGVTTFGDAMSDVVAIVSAAVTIVVVAIPEGLPLAVTLNLAYSMKRMMADNAMVRRLSACETMGSATVICTDKTGTLTTNKMKVVRFWQGQECVVNGEAVSTLSRNVLELIREGVALNTTGNVCKSDSGEELEFSGSPTETAILGWAVSEIGMDMDEVRSSCSVVRVEAFNSKKKMSGVLAARNGGGGDLHAHWKGAAEMILGMCSRYYDAAGNVKALTGAGGGGGDGEMVKFQNIIQGMAASSLRCIALAHKRVVESDSVEAAGDGITDSGLTLVGIVGLKDPCRPGAKAAVADCQRAGVSVKMITGDNIFTAKAIAAECGILRGDDDEVVEGVVFRNYTPEERREKVDKICVMARSSPFDKLLMVECLRQKGHVVAVTGDGTNDAPALKEADVGLSMGIQGTEVAKESSDIVILDDNFASVATVLRWGRCVYANIQKFIQFQLTVNAAALVINFVAAVSSGDVPLTAVQLLWVNLIMDTLGALALATERPTAELMDRRPVGRSEPLISNAMWRNLLAQAVYQVAVLLTLQFAGEDVFGLTKDAKNTLIFNAFVLCQVFNEFNARRLEKKNVFEGLVSNRLFLGITGVTILLQVLMVELLNDFADTERLDWGQWGVCVGIASLSWPIGFAVKYVPVPVKPFFSYLKLTRFHK